MLNRRVTTPLISEVPEKHKARLAIHRQWNRQFLKIDSSEARAQRMSLWKRIQSENRLVAILLASLRDDSRVVLDGLESSDVELDSLM